MSRILLLLALILGIVWATVFVVPAPTPDQDSIKVLSADESVAANAELEGGAPVAQPVASQPAEAEATAISRIDQGVPKQDLDVAFFGNRKQPILIGRILNTEGMVGKNLNIEVFVRVQDDSFDSTVQHSARTDDFGRFQLKPGKRYRVGRTRTATFAMHKTKRKLRRTAVVDLSHPISPGVHDLGDLVVTVPPLVAKGRVVDLDGKGVSNAVVRLMRQEYQTHNGVFQRMGQKWMRELQVTADKSGNYAMHGNLDPGEYSLDVSCVDYQSSTEPIKVGVTSMDVLLMHYFQVKGKILLDADIPTRGITVGVYDKAPSENIFLDTKPLHRKGFFLQRTALDEHGVYRLGRLMSTDVNIEVLCRATGEVLFEQHGVRLDPRGDATRAPLIDLRGMLRWAIVEPVQPSGKPVRGLQFRFNGGELLSASSWGGIPIVTRSASINIYLRGEQVRDSERHNIQGRTQILMAGGIPISVAADGLSTVPKGWGLRCEFYRFRNDGETHLDMDSGATVDQLVLGRTSFSVLSTPGNVIIDIVLWHPDGRSASVLAGRAASPKLHVLDTTTGQHFPISISPDWVAAALKEAKAGKKEDYKPSLLEGETDGHIHD